jgi:ribosomal protein S18 acetylase RimI-like enzyme
MTTPTLALRPVRPEDQSFLYEVYASTRADELARVGWSTEQMQDFLQMQFRAQQQQYQFSYPNAARQIIEHNGLPVGRLIVDRSANETLLVDIALLSEFRNLGIGTSLLCDLLAEGNKVTLNVIRSNPAANLYQRLGFVFCGGRSVPFEDGMVARGRAEFSVAGVVHPRLPSRQPRDVVSQKREDGRPVWLLSGLGRTRRHRRAQLRRADLDVQRAR